MSKDKEQSRLSKLRAKLQKVVKPDGPTLEELQKDIYKKEKDILKLQQKATTLENKNQIAEKRKEIAQYQNLLNNRLEKLLKENQDYSELINQGNQKNKDKAAKKQLDSWNQELQKIKNELSNHEKLVDRYKKKEQKQIEKLTIEEKKVEEKTESSYQEEKDKAFRIAKDILKDRDGMEKILTPLLSSKKQEDTISAGQKLQAAMKGIGFAASHISQGIAIATSVSFYAEEVAKIQKIFNGETPYDPSHPPFFIRLLKDPDTSQFLTDNTVILNDLVQHLAPMLITVMLKELGEINNIKKEFDEHKKDIDSLPTLEKELQILKDKKDISKIPKLEEKVNYLKSLQKNYDRAILFNNLKEAALDKDYINSKLLPIVQDITISMLEKPEDLLKIINLSVDMLIIKDPETKKDYQSKILDTIDVSSLLKSGKLSKFLIEEKKYVEAAAEVIISSNMALDKRLEDFGVGKELLRDVVPIVSEFAGIALQDPKKVDALYETLKSVILDDTDSKIREANNLQEVAALDKAGGIKKLAVVQQLPEILLQNEMLELLHDQLPATLTKHKGEIAKIAATTIPKLLEMLDNNARTLAKECNKTFQEEDVHKIVVSPIVPMLNGVDHKFYESIIPISIDLLKNTMTVLNVEDIKEIYSDMQTLAKTEDVEQKDQATERLNKHVITLLKNKDLQQNIAVNLPQIIKDNEAVVAVIANNIVSNNQDFKKYDLSAELINATTSLAIKVVDTGLSKMPTLMKINDNWQEYQRADIDTDAKEKVLTKIIDDVGEIVQSLSPILEHSVPEYLQTNKDSLLALTENMIKQEELKRQLDSAGVSSDLAFRMVDTAINITPHLLPIITKFANASLTDKDGVVAIASKFQGLLNSSEQEKDSKGKELADSVVQFIERNAAVKDVIIKDIPKLLNENSAILGPIVDEFLNSTFIGRNLKIKGQEIIEKISEKVPALTEIAMEYNKGNYLSVITGTFKLLSSDPVARGMVTKLLVEGVKYKVQTSFTSYKKRRQRWHEYAGEIIDKVRKHIPTINGQKADLGELLQQQADNMHVANRSKTLEYSLISRDFSGLIFNNETNMPLENVKINGFNFNDATFMHNSFQNSEISNCSFKGTDFKEKISFTGATIDAKSLETLLPAIKQYNKNHKKDPITLDNVQFTGDISKLSFKGVSVNNRSDITVAKLAMESKLNHTDHAKKIGKDIAHHMSRSVQDDKNTPPNVAAIKESISKHISTDVVGQTKNQMKKTDPHNPNSGLTKISR